MIKLDLDFAYNTAEPMHFSLNVEQGERVAIIGESGAGKSTLLNLIAGFNHASRGILNLNHQDHFSTPAAVRPVSMLFQQDNLFLHLKVWENIALGIVPSLKLSTAQKAQITQIAAQMGIGDLLERKAVTLSGGQQQRTALARTLLRQKPILLLDEPFSALDPNRRHELQLLVKQVCEQQQLTLLMVTHQIEEHRSLFTRTIEIKQGHISS